MPFFAQLFFSLRTEMAVPAIPVFRPAYFTPRLHWSLGVKTLGLQVFDPPDGKKARSPVPYLRGGTTSTQ